MTALDAIEAISRLGCFLGAMGHLFFFFRSWSKLDSSKAGADTIHEPKKPVPRSREKAEKGENANDCAEYPYDRFPAAFQFFYHGLLFLVFYSIFKL